MSEFYCSDSGTYQTPDERGFYIGYKTESGDSEYLGPYDNDMTREEADAVLKRDAEWEWDDGVFYARVTSVQFNQGGK